MSKWESPLQYAYTDPAAPPGREFKRFGTPIISDEHLQAVRKSVNHTNEYLSVYGWIGWPGGKLTVGISKTARINGIFLDFDDAADPQKAIQDAAEVTAYVGHSSGNFSGAKGAHLWIRCHPVDLIPDTKGRVIRQFVNDLYDRLPELDTLDFSVVGDTSRVRRIINSVHSKTGLYAIGLTPGELTTLTIDEIQQMARYPRETIPAPEPSQWVTDELIRIEGEILINRLTRLWAHDLVSDLGYQTAIEELTHNPTADRVMMHNNIKALEDMWLRISLEKVKNQVSSMGGRRVGRSPAETWLIGVVEIFKIVQRMNSIRPARSKVSTSFSEHEARCHITHLMDDCGWTREEMHSVFSYADDYRREKTERMINSLIGGR